MSLFNFLGKRNFDKTKHTKHKKILVERIGKLSSITSTVDDKVKVRIRTDWKKKINKKKRI